MQMQKKERRLLLILLVGILMAGGVYLYGGKPAHQEQTVQQKEGQVTAVSPEVQGNQQLIKVHVKGEVNQPGVYQLPGDSRINDAIQAAGGAKSGADVEQLNLAAPVADGAEVVVPQKGEAAEQAAVPSSAKDAKVNINTATAEELDKLPGIGSTRAQAIVDYRKEQGRFLQVEDLRKVQGIGVKLFDQIKEKVTVQ